MHPATSSPPSRSGTGHIYGATITDPEFGAPSIDGDNNFYETPPLTNISVTLRVTF